MFKFYDEFNEIHNHIISLKIIEKLGANLIEIIDVPKDYFGWYKGIKKHCIFNLILK